MQSKQEKQRLLLNFGIENVKKESWWWIQFSESLKLGKVTHLKTLHFEHKTYPTWSFNFFNEKKTERVLIYMMIVISDKWIVLKNDW